MTRYTTDHEDEKAFRFGGNPNQKKPPTVVITPESAVLNAMIRWLYTQRIVFWRNNTGGFRPEGSKRAIRFGFPGSADVLAIQPGTGKLLCLEAKSTTGHQTESQIAFQKMVEAAGAAYFLIRSVDDLEKHKDLILGRGT